MKYRVTVEGTEREVDVVIAPDGRISATLDGAPFDADIVRADGGLSIRRGARIFDVAAGGKAEAMQVAIGGDRATVSVQSERQRGARRGGGKAGGARDVRSPMPGRVVKVLVAIGDEVPPGTPVVVVEAMKMENELRAAVGGRVESLHAKAGDTVDGGALLVKFAEA
jgi:biotin carboxyl carrier protein